MPIFRFPVALMLLGASALAQTCPPFQFVHPNEAQLLSNNTPGTAWLQRLADGSFTRQTALGNWPLNYQNLDPVTHFEQQFLSCTGLPARTSKPPVGWLAGGENLAGRGSMSFIAGDFLGTGLMSRACVGACAASGQLQTVLSNSFGNFLAGTTTYPVPGGSPQSLVAADVNNDGRRDILVVATGLSDTAPGSVSVYLMNADGSLQAPKTFAAGAGAVALAAGDVNGDNNVDVLVANSFDRTIMVFLGQGDGTFLPSSVLQTNASPLSLALADINGDGRVDIVAALGVEGVAVFPSVGQGAFGGAVTNTTSDSAYVTFVAAADVNKDGRMDVVALDSALNSVVILYGRPDDPFLVGRRYLIGTQATSFFLTDFDWDGNLDIVFASGHPDLLSGPSTTNVVSVLFGAGDGTFYGVPALYTHRSQPNGVAIGDFNQDGIPDVAELSGAFGNVHIAISQSGSGFSPMPPVQIVVDSFGTRGALTGVAAADFDGDGKTDLAIVEVGRRRIYLAAGKGDGTFQPPVFFSSTTQEAVDISAGDVNGDGKLDLVISNGLAGNLLVFLNDGTGAFGSPLSVPSGSPSNHAAIVDVNGDGKPDLVVTNGADPSGSGGIRVLLGNGIGTFQAAVQYPVLGFARSAAVADLNGDGKPDIAVIASKTNGANELSVFLNQGNGSFVFKGSLASNIGAVQLAIADFTLDGKPDLLVAHCCGDTAMMTILPGKGDGTFDAEIALLAGNSQSSVFAANLNSDAKPDALFTSGTSTTTVAMIINTGTSAGGIAVPSIVSPASGSTLTSSATFTWTSVAGATKYRLLLGSAAGGSDLASQETTALSVTAGGLPSDGRTVYASVAAFVNGSYGTAGTASFKASTVAGVPVLSNPTPGSTLSGSSTTFQWSAVNGATKYRLLIGSAPAAADVFTQETGGTSLAVAVLPTDSRTLYVSIAAFVGGAYGTAGTATYHAATASVPPIVSRALRFVTVRPCRIADTRNAAGPFGAPSIAAGGTRSFAVPASACGIPANAAAYSLNVTVVPQGSLGYLTLWPTGQPQPTVSTLNSFDGRIKANAAIVPAGTDGAVSLFATHVTEVILDINGYFVPAAANASALQFYPLPPCRIADTRNPPGLLGGPPLPAGGSKTIPVQGSNCGVPAGAQAYSLNFTAVPKGPLSFLTTWPSAQPQPLVSTLNALTGTITANAAIVPAGANGAIDVFVFNAADVIVDINGYFAAPAAGGLSFYSLAPCRVSDTRNPAGTFGGPALSGGGARSWPVASSSCGIPASAQAVALNATALPSATLSYLTLWPASGAQPLVSTLNSFDGAVVSNAAIVPTSGDSGIRAFVTDNTELILDVSGYFAP